MSPNHFQVASLFKFLAVWVRGGCPKAALMWRLLEPGPFTSLHAQEIESFFDVLAIAVIMHYDPLSMLDQRGGSLSFQKGGASEGWEHVIFILIITSPVIIIICSSHCCTDDQRRCCCSCIITLFHLVRPQAVPAVMLRVLLRRTRDFADPLLYLLYR